MSESEIERIAVDQDWQRLLLRLVENSVEVFKKELKMDNGTLSHVISHSMETQSH